LNLEIAMKKLIFGLLASVVVSNAMAVDAGTALSGSQAVTPDAQGCSLLSEGVTINLSAGVVGAYACNTVSNVVGVAACHPNGRKGDVTSDCDPVPVTADPANGVAGNVPPVGCVLKTNPANANDGTVTVRGGIAYAASTSGGRVGGVNASACSGQNASTIDEAKTAAGL
jgi:hypothetical protein